MFGCCESCSLPMPRSWRLAKREVVVLPASTWTQAFAICMYSQKNRSETNFSDSLHGQDLKAVRSLRISCLVLMHSVRQTENMHFPAYLRVFAHSIPIIRKILHTNYVPRFSIQPASRQFAAVRTFVPTFLLTASAFPAQKGLINVPAMVHAGNAASGAADGQHTVEVWVQTGVVCG